MKNMELENLDIKEQKIENFEINLDSSRVIKIDKRFLKFLNMDLVEENSAGIDLQYGKLIIYEPNEYLLKWLKDNRIPVELED